MSGPLDRPADPTGTPAMPDADVDEVWHWLGVMAGTPGQNPDWPLLLGVANLLREIDRARAAEKKLNALAITHDRPTTPPTKET